MNIKIWLKQAEKFVTDNSPALLTTIGVVGTVGTAILASKASFKAASLIQDDAILNRDNPDYVYNTKRAAKLVWPLYIPSLVSGTLTCGAIVFANRIGTRRAAALAAAYSVSEKAFAEYKEKVVEKIGEKKEAQVRDEIAQDRVNANPVSDRTVIVATGETLCMEAYTGRYFMSDYESIRKAENDIREQTMNEGYASLGDLYHILGIPRTDISEEVGWIAEKQPKISISATVAEDNKPCLVMSYDVTPIRDYFRFH